MSVFANEDMQEKMAVTAIGIDGIKTLNAWSTGHFAALRVSRIFFSLWRGGRA